MDEVTTTTPKRRSRMRLWIEITVGVCLLAMVIGLALYVNSPGFADFVRRKVVETIEDATGGRVEMASFRWNLSQLSFEAQDVTIHGLEPPGQLPYAHVDRAFIDIHVISFLERRVSLKRVELQHPVIHLIVNADGTTNAPEPKVKPTNTKPAVQELFDLAIGQADLRDGLIVVNDHKMPLDFSASDLAAKMTYDWLAKRYDGNVQVGKMDLKYADYRDVPASANLDFSLWHNQLDVKSLKLVSEKSTLEVKGKVNDFQKPEINATYSTSLDLMQVGAIARDPQLRGGTAQINGSLSYSEAAGRSMTGSLALHELDYVDAGLDLRKANLSTNFSLANNQLQLTRIAGRLLGGEVAGEADIRNVFASEAPAPQPEPVVPKGKQKHAAPPPSNVQEGAARLRVSGVSLNELARMFSTRAMPLDKLNAVGHVAGNVNLTWKQSIEKAVAEMAIDSTAPSQAAGNQLPVNGSLRGRYNVISGRTDISSLSLITPHTQVNASGALGSTTVGLALKLNATSLSDFQPLLASLGATPPIDLGGSLSFDGTINGHLRAPDIAGHVEASNFSYIYTPTVKPTQVQPVAAKTETKHRSWLHPQGAPAPPPQPPVASPRRIHVDHFSGDVQYSQNEVALQKATIQEGTALLKIDGTTALDRGAFTDDSRFQVHAAVHDADVTDLQRISGTDFPLTGKVNFTVQASGTAADPHGDGHVSLTGASCMAGRSRRSHRRLPSPITRRS